VSIALQKKCAHVSRFAVPNVDDLAVEAPAFRRGFMSALRKIRL